MSNSKYASSAEAIDYLGGLAICKEPSCTESVWNSYVKIHLYLGVVLCIEHLRGTQKGLRAKRKYFH